MWPAIMAALPGIISAGAGVAGMFGNQNKTNPATQANKALGQIPGQVAPYYQPYVNAGKSALYQGQSQYNTLINNPQEVYDKLGQGYKESPGYQARLAESLKAGTNAAAAGGSLGAGMHQEELMQRAHDISDQDYEAYLNHMLGLYGQGLQGNEGINKMGFDANTSMGNLTGSVTAQQAQNNFSGQQGQNQQRQQNLQNIFGGGAAAFQAANNANDYQDYLNWKQSQGVH